MVKKPSPPTLFSGRRPCGSGVDTDGTGCNNALPPILKSGGEHISIVNEPNATPFDQPLTIYSIEDLNAWRRWYYHPLPLQVGERVETGVCDILIEGYQRIPPSLKAHYRIASKSVFLESFDLLMKLSMVAGMRAYRDGRFYIRNRNVPQDVRFPDRCMVYDLYRGVEDVPLPDLRLTYHDAYYRELKRFRKAGQRIKGWLENARRRSHDEKRTYCITPNAETIQYVMKVLGIRYRLIRPELIFDTYTRTRGNAADAVQAFADWMMSALNRLLENITGETISATASAAYKMALVGLFGRIGCELGAARRALAHLPSDSNLYTGTAKHYTRVVSEVVRERGGTVIGFPHEGGLSGLHLPSLAFTEFATCDRFACLLDDDARSYDRYPKINPVSFFTISGGHSLLWADALEAPPSHDIDLAAIDTIMYVCYGQHFDIFGSATRSDLQGLSLHLEVLEYLIGLNKRVVFKNPIKSEILSKHHNHFDYFGDKVIYRSEPFTQILDTADLFVLEGVGSTVLHEAMTLTDKPIVLLKPPYPRCDDHLTRKLQQRCCVIDLYEDERNRLRFRPDDFNRVLKI